MKKFYAILCIAIASLTQLQAQAPQGFNYQATVRNSSGDLIVNTNVYFKFNIIQGSQTSLPVFTETHYVPTDDLGQVNLIIGQGTANTGVFSELDWSLGSYYLGIELDTGSGYVAMGTTQLLSVPYALYAESSGSSSSGFPSGGTEGQVLSIVSGVPTWTDLSGSTDSENLAEITTVEASDIDFESMISGGNINNDGGFTITSKGVVWSESPDPTIELETKTDEGGGASSFTSTITGLDEETEYFYRAYAITSAGTAYGSTYSITTDSSQFYDQDGDGFTPDQGDCNDYDANEYPGQIWYFDQDGDGYAQDTNESCTRPGGGLLLSEISGAGDCDDSNANVNPGATEIEDGIDNDCDGEIDEGFSNLPNNLGIVGSAVNNWGVSGPDTPLVYQGNGIYEAYVTFIDGELKFRDNNDWLYNWGDTGADGILDQTGDNIAVVAGVYLVTVNWLDMTYTLQQIDTTLTDGENNTYTTLPYGNQIWSTTNAEMVTYRDGTPIPQVTDATEWSNLTTGAWVYYNNDPTKPRLYNWYAVMGIHDTDPNTPNKEFAPEGWHVPTDVEWITLEEYLIANGYNYDDTTTENKIAKAMSSTTGWNGSTELGAIGNDQSLNNSSGFNAFPEGSRYILGSFNGEGSKAAFWSSTENGTNSASYRGLYSFKSNLNRYQIYKGNGHSVRFVRD